MKDKNIERFTSEKLKITTYKYWDFYLHPNQYPYIGRCYAWAKRNNAISLPDMRKEERDELFDTIIPEWEQAVKQLFNHDLTNFAIFANTARHLHAHCIPRYNTERIFERIAFIDPNPTGNYAPYEKKEIPVFVFEAIKEKLKGVIRKNFEPLKISK